VPGAENGRFGVAEVSAVWHVYSKVDKIYPLRSLNATQVRVAHLVQTVSPHTHEQCTILPLVGLGHCHQPKG